MTLVTAPRLRRVAVLPAEAELGAQRQCTGCSEWWPLDREFWYFRVRYGVISPEAVCRACKDARTRLHRSRS